MSADPTAEHIDAVARTLSTPDWGEWSSAYHPDHNKWTFDGSHRTDGEREMYRNAADAVLTSTDPAVHEALAANLPADVMLDALVRAGVLTRHVWGPTFGGAYQSHLQTTPEAATQDDALAHLRERMSREVAE